ncbi:hypothetical protein [Bacillus wiedmannii]|uniref:hypothetical protein n=1 Tax=Bacillus wiedmannii TaxID=1890302 RepID=UPI000BFC1892|nr:hypothetical protein [Bacillus wiedmannii]PHF91584.1 hypothetical protein COI45_22945 [Bacillus wiedmannii]
MLHNILNIKRDTIKNTLYCIFGIIILFVIFRWMDTLASNSFVEAYGKRIFTLRGTLLDFLLRIAPLFITVVIAISSLTVNSYTGTFLSLLLEDKSLKYLILFTVSFMLYRLLVIFSIGAPSQVTDGFLVENFVTYTADLILGFLYALYICGTSIHIFLYCSPEILKKKFLKQIKDSIATISEYIHSTSKERLDISNVYKLNNQIGLFTNLLMRSIKSKDYKDISSTIRDIGEIWRDFVEYKEDDSARDSADEQFYAYIQEIIQNEKALNIVGDGNLSEETSKEKQKVFEQCVNKLGQVFVDCFDVGFSQGEYFVCDEILKTLYNISQTKDIQAEDIGKLFKIYNEIFEVTMRHDKKSQTTKYINEIMLYVNKIYKQHAEDIKDFNVYYQFLIIAVNLNEPKITKHILIKLHQLLTVDEINYKDAIIQLKKILIHSLKFKRMKCFAELIRFTVVNDLRLNLINEVLSEGIIFEENLDDFQKLLDELSSSTDPQGVNYRRENYYAVKLYIIWFSYYNLQLHISPRRIDSEFHTLKIPRNIKYNVPFETIRTVLLDIETHLDNWRKLFVTREKHYFIENAFWLLKPVERGLFQTEIEEFGETKMLKKMLELTTSSV